MSLIKIYHSLPVFLQNAAITVYGLRLRQLRYGSTHAETTRKISERCTWSKDQLIEYQGQELQRVMVAAAATVPFYRKQQLPVPASPREAIEYLSEWPIVEKKMVQEDPSQFVCDSQQGKSLNEIHTGGTTGRALAILADKNDLQRNYAFFERFKQMCGVRRNSRTATLAGRLLVPPASSKPPYWRHNWASKQLLLSSYHIGSQTADQYLDAIHAFRPELIDSYPSSIEPLARRALETGRRIDGVKAVITSSETLATEVRRSISAAFGCSVFDHYGSAEMVALITQCINGSYHINDDFGYVELLDANGKPTPYGQQGEIVSTGFVNHSMLLVRYRMGDVGTSCSSLSECGCGLPFSRIEQIVGRVDDVLYTPDGRQIGRLDPIFKAVRSLHEAKIIQDAVDRVTILIVAGETFTRSEEQSLVTELQSRLGPAMTIQVQRVERIERTARGKLRLVENRIPQSTNT